MARAHRSALLSGLLLAGLSAALPQGAWGQAAALGETASLRGVDGVRVIVDPVDPDAEAAGLTGEAVRGRMERRLLQAGIPVLSAEEWDGTDRRPYLHVMLLTRKREGSSTYAIAMTVSLAQQVALLDSAATPASATTWSRSTVGTVSASRMFSVGSGIDQLVDEFIDEWREANPGR